MCLPIISYALFICLIFRFDYTQINKIYTTYKGNVAIILMCFLYIVMCVLSYVRKGIVITGNW